MKGNAAQTAVMFLLNENMPGGAKRGGSAPLADHADAATDLMRAIIARTPLERCADK